jgi:AcrR family transcriptional regulator
MARPQRYSTDGILDATRELVLESGAGAATIEGIARASGAPSGSIYYRFGSRDQMIAELWMRTVRRFQVRFLAALASREDPVETAVAGALSIYDFAVEEPGDARLLISLRRADLIHLASLGPKTRRELELLNRPIDLAMRELADRIFGARTRATLELTVLAVIDVPYGAVRRLLVAGSKRPITLRGPLERAVFAVLTTKGADDARKS